MISCTNSMTKIRCVACTSGGSRAGEETGGEATQESVRQLEEAHQWTAYQREVKQEILGESQATRSKFKQKWQQSKFKQHQGSWQASTEVSD